MPDPETFVLKWKRTWLDKADDLPDAIFDPVASAYRLVGVTERFRANRASYSMLLAGDRKLFGEMGNKWIAEEA